MKSIFSKKTAKPGLRPSPWRLAAAFAAALVTDATPRGADVAALAWAAVARLEAARIAQLVGWMYPVIYL